jgi:hypothetical protein
LRKKKGYDGKEAEKRKEKKVKCSQKRKIVLKI